MEAITRHNYESFFLDFAEGNLTAEEKAAVLDFVNQNPDLRAELEAFEVIELQPSPEAPSADWSGLIQDKGDNQERLFFKAVEGNLSPSEQVEFQQLLEDPKNQAAYAQWQKTVLHPEAMSLDKDPLYHLELLLPIATHNYEHFLIARGEGLLNAEQEKALTAYAQNQSTGEADMRLSNALRLKPAQGIFYPDKNSLYRKEKKGLVIWYRIAAVAAILLLAVLFFMPQSGQVEQATVAQELPKPKTQLPDSVPTKAEKPDSNAVKSLQPPVLEEWEIREPDPAYVAEQVENEDREKTENLQTAQPEEIDLDIEREMPENLEPILADEQAPLVPNEEKYQEPLDLPEEPILAEVGEIPSEQGEDFQTVPELAEDVLASSLEIPDDQRDKMALAIAKKVTDKAAEMLNSELKSESSDNGEQMTYTLRIRNFKISHSKRR